jgi:hypothetical protein
MEEYTLILMGRLFSKLGEVMSIHEVLIPLKTKKTETV